MQKKKGAPMIYSVLCAGECIQKKGGQNHVSTQAGYLSSLKK